MCLVPKEGLATLWPVELAQRWSWSVLGRHACLTSSSFITTNIADALSRKWSSAVAPRNAVDRSALIVKGLTAERVHYYVAAASAAETASEQRHVQEYSNQIVFRILTRNSKPFRNCHKHFRTHICSSSTFNISLTCCTAAYFFGIACAEFFWQCQEGWIATCPHERKLSLWDGCASFYVFSPPQGGGGGGKGRPSACWRDRKAFRIRQVWKGNRGLLASGVEGGTGMDGGGRWCDDGLQRRSVGVVVGLVGSRGRRERGGGDYNLPPKFIGTLFAKFSTDKLNLSGCWIEKNHPDDWIPLFKINSWFQTNLLMGTSYCILITSPFFHWSILIII